MIKIESKKVIRSAKKLSVFILYFLVYIRYIIQSRLKGPNYNIKRDTKTFI